MGYSVGNVGCQGGSSGEEDIPMTPSPKFHNPHTPLKTAIRPFYWDNICLSDRVPQYAMVSRNSPMKIAIARSIPYVQTDRNPLIIG